MHVHPDHPPRHYSCARCGWELRWTRRLPVKWLRYWRAGVERVACDRCRRYV